jgi:hypothetical protein
LTRGPVCARKRLKRFAACVAGFGSHFSRLAFEIASGRGALRAPPLVVDVPWTSF